MYTDLLLIPWFQLHGWTLFGPVKIQPFGILVATGIFVGAHMCERRSLQTGIPPRLISDFLTYTIIIGFVFAMLLNLVFYDQDRAVQIGKAVASWFGSGPSVAFPYPGLSSFGGFIGGVGAAFWFRQRKRVSIMAMGDLFCFGFPFAWFFGRMGCFTVHDHPGLVSHFFLAVDDYNGQGLPRHDLGFYEVLWSIVASALVLWLGKSPRPRGFFMAFIPIFYAPIRFFLDYLREVPINGGDVRYYGLTPGQYGALAMLVAGVLVAIRIARGPEATIYIDGSNEAPADSDAPVLATAAAGGTSASGRPKKKRKK